MTRYLECDSELSLYAGEQCSPIGASALALKKAKYMRSHSKLYKTFYEYSN